MAKSFVAGPVYMDVPVPRVGDLAVVCWLTEDWTKDWGKMISLNSDFKGRILHKRCIGVIASRRCSLCWMSKIYITESLKTQLSISLCRQRV